MQFVVVLQKMEPECSTINKLNNITKKYLTVKNVQWLKVVKKRDFNDNRLSKTTNAEKYKDSFLTR